MKISGPKGPGPTPPTTKPDADAARADRPGFQELLRQQETGPTAGAPDAGAVAEVVARLEAGELTGTQAAEMLIEAIVRQQVGAATPALRERIRAALQQIVAADPVLSEKIRRLAGED